MKRTYSQSFKCFALAIALATTAVPAQAGPTPLPYSCTVAKAPGCVDISLIGQLLAWLGVDPA